MSDETSSRTWTHTRHAEIQMRRRKVPFEAISYVLENYVIRRPAPPRDAARPAEILIGEFEGRTLRVYVERGTDPPMIKTVAWED